MTPGIALFAITALFPAMTGPFPADRARVMTVMLCGGGSAAVPLGSGAPAGDGSAPCCAKGCHSSCSRKRIDRAQ